jgi:AMP deaminase
MLDARPTHLGLTDNYGRDEGDTDVENSWEESPNSHIKMLPDAALQVEDSPGTGTPSDADGMLPRDIQRKTAYYDYAAEKSLSQADSKLFYQRSQLEAQRTGGSSWGASQTSQHGGSPVLQPRYSNRFGQDTDGIRRSESTASHKSGHPFSSQRYVLYIKSLDMY